MKKIKEAVVRLVPYVIALIGVLLAAAARYLLGPILGGLIPVVVFTLPVVATAIFGGFGPAIFATVLSAVAANYLFIEPRYSFEIRDQAAVVILVVFLFIGFSISLMGGWLKKLQKKTQAQAALLSLQSSMKDEFLAMLAHELRNPVACIGMAAEVLKSEQLDASRRVRSCSTIARQVEHMAKLIDDLLDVSRLTRGLVVVEKRSVDIKEVINDAKEQVEALFSRKNHELVFQFPDSPVYVLGDHMRLVQLVVNLLNNAARYTKEKGLIVLTVEAKNDECLLRIKDNGIGMAQDFLPHIFTPFVQAKRTSDRSQGGLGLGLALVQTVANLHEGKVVVHSDGPGHGSTFTVLLPLLKAPSIASKQMSPVFIDDGSCAKSSSHRLRIMVIEDNADAASTFGFILEGQGHVVTIVHSAQAALDLAQSKSFDIIYSDIGLPEMDGYALVSLIKKMPHLSKATFVAMSGYGRSEDLERSKLAGFEDHLIKPVTMDALNQTLIKALPLH